MGGGGGGGGPPPLSGESSGGTIIAIAEAAVLPWKRPLRSASVTRIPSSRSSRGALEMSKKRNVGISETGLCASLSLVRKRYGDHYGDACHVDEWNVVEWEMARDKWGEFGVVRLA